MASSSLSRLPIPFASETNALILVDKHNYVPEPPMEENKTVIWASHILIPFSIYGTIHTFLGPSLTASKKPEHLNKFFPCHTGHKPIILQGKAYELRFINSPRRVFYDIPSPKN